MKRFQTIGLIAKRREPHLPTVAAVLATLRAAGCTVLLEEHPALTQLEARRLPRAELARAVELVVVVGGDGTLLDAGRSLAPAGVPILGVNQGRLGFLTDVRTESLDEVFGTVLAGAYESEQRLTLEVSLAGRTAEIAINDVVLRNQASIRMLEFETWMDEEPISSHRADGLIVCSPTGSTAYALSGGGPLLHPGLEALALVPICPHTLSDRPIVVGADRRIRIVVHGGERTDARVTLDGQIGRTLRPGETVSVARSPHRLRLIHPVGFSWFSLLRNKLRWGSGPDPNAERA